MNFTYRENATGGFEVYNDEIGDIYFSNVGAHKEALEKFAVPSLPVLKNKKELKILDVCYGMGYNSKTFVDYILKNNIDNKCDIDAIEIDKNILALGLFIFDENINKDIHLFFGKKILELVNLEKNIENISGENWIKNIFDKNKGIFKSFCEKSEVDLYQTCEISSFLHNIYYQNQLNFEKIIKLDLKLGDLRKILPNLDVGYDLIFHDAFSILKQPELWEKDILEYYFNILNPNGRLLTYSNSRVLRRRLAEIGFDVEINYTENEKQNGTVAIKT
ncbi:MAG: hypothetical protein K6A44_03660 [bacterium]|nr:hypothetical protein [bacterium]